MEDSAQATLLDWYNRGLDLFRDSCSAGYLIFETFREPLLAQLQQRTPEFEELLVATAEFTLQTRRELREDATGCWSAIPASRSWPPR